MALLAAMTKKVWTELLIVLFFSAIVFLRRTHAFVPNSVLLKSISVSSRVDKASMSNDNTVFATEEITSPDETSSDNGKNGDNAAVETTSSLDFVIASKPLGMILEELNGGGVGVYCADCDEDGAAHAAGIRIGDVLASVNGCDAIRSSSLEGAVSILTAAAIPISVRVHRGLLRTTGASYADNNDKVNNTKKEVVRMAPRKLPSTKKLIKASTNKNFWKDPLMIGSAVLTVAMPLGIYAASVGGKGM